MNSETIELFQNRILTLMGAQWLFYIGFSMMNFSPCQLLLILLPWACCVYLTSNIIYHNSNYLFISIKSGKFWMKVVSISIVFFLIWYVIQLQKINLVDSQGIKVIQSMFTLRF